jgi:hypothetical protein
MDHTISSTQEIQDGKVSQIEQLSCVGHSLKAKMAFYIQLLINHKPCTIIHMCKLECFLLPRANSCSCIFAVEGAYNAQIGSIEFENLHEP